MQRVLVVGGAGLVGSHLVDRLLADGCEVIAIDDLSRGSYANIAHLKRERRFVFREHDVAAPFRAKVDRIFHLALPSTRAACANDPVRAAMTCVSGTMNALDVAAQSGARLVLGTATERWGVGVRCAESLALDFVGARDIDLSVVRLPSTYGPRIAPDGAHLVVALVLQALRGERLTVPGPEHHVQLTYVDDAVETLVRVMASEPRLPEALAPSSTVSVLELADVIATAAGVAAPSRADARSARAAVGPEPSVDLTEGIARTMRWFEERMGRGTRGRPSGVYGCDTPVHPPLPAPARAGLGAG